MSAAGGNKGATGKKRKATPLGFFDPPPPPPPVGWYPVSARADPPHLATQNVSFRAASPHWTADAVSLRHIRTQCSPQHSTANALVVVQTRLRTTRARSRSAAASSPRIVSFSRPSPGLAIVLVPPAGLRLTGRRQACHPRNHMHHSQQRSICIRSSGSECSNHIMRKVACVLCAISCCCGKPTL